jgi:acylphosphatase
MKNDDTHEICIRALITGRVQGVWYRGWTMETAVGLGLRGWVRNRSDGSVEALFVGPADKVAAMLAACRRGPPAAQVVDITTEPAEPPAGLVGFSQSATG